jgi:hypothetical protein
MIYLHEVIYTLNPTVTVICGDVAYNNNGQEVSYDIAQAKAKLAELQAQAQADAQAVINTKASALAKLAALGLTQDEVKALVG